MSLTHTCMWNNSEINCVCEIFFSHTYVRAGAELICNAWYYSIYHIVTMLLVYMVGSAVFGQFRQIENKSDTNRRTRLIDHRSILHSRGPTLEVFSLNISAVCDSVPVWNFLSNFWKHPLNLKLAVLEWALESWNSQSLMCTTTAPLVSYLNVDIWGMSKYKNMALEGSFSVLSKPILQVT